MRIPEKSPQLSDIIGKLSTIINEFFIKYCSNDEESEKFKNLIRKYNNDEYIHWDKLRRKEDQSDVEALWFFLKFARGNQFESLKIADESFKYIVLEKFQKELSLIDLATPTPYDWLNEEGFSPEIKSQHLLDSLMEEAIASSQLEGAATTRIVAKKLIREDKEPIDTSQKMILNNYRTIIKIKEIRDKKLTPELILEIHEGITHGTLSDELDETRFRNTNDIVVQDKVQPDRIYHIPPDFSKINPMINDLCRFANGNHKYIHPIIKATILHFLIGYIHPFNDGNGRTARALFYWYVLKEKRYLFEYLSISRIFLESPSKYTLAYLYTETDENDMTYFLDYNLEIISRAFDDLRLFIRRKHAEQREALDIIDHNPNISFRQAQILKDLIKNPLKYTSFKEIESKYKISFPTARSDLLHLEEMGKVRKIKKGRQFVFYSTSKN